MQYLGVRVTGRLKEQIDGTTTPCTNDSRSKVAGSGNLALTAKQMRSSLVDLPDVNTNGKGHLHCAICKGTMHAQRWGAGTRTCKMDIG